MSADPTDTLVGLVSAATVWMSRQGLVETPDDTLVLIGVFPGAIIGVARPGLPSAAMRPPRDDDAAELCDAAAGFADAAVRSLQPEVLRRLAPALDRGCRLRVACCPGQGHAALLTDDGRQQVVLTVAALEPATEH